MKSEYEWVTRATDYNKGYRQFRRDLKRAGYEVKTQDLTTEDLDDMIRSRIQRGGQATGYRKMWAQLWTEFGVRVDRKEVRKRMRIIDPVGVRARRPGTRRRRGKYHAGVNQVWHLDSWEKLAAYGLYIHGGIDGESRFIVYMTVALTKRKEDIYTSFLEGLNRVRRHPDYTRSDNMTEGVLIAEHMLRNVGPDSYRQGSSTSNIVIERFWNILREGCTWWYVDALDSLAAAGLFERNKTHHKQSVLVVFGVQLSMDVENFVNTHNQSRIRAMRERSIASKIPAQEFFEHSEEEPNFGYVPARYRRRPRPVYAGKEWLASETFQTIRNELFEAYSEYSDNYKLRYIAHVVMTEECYKLENGATIQQLLGQPLDANNTRGQLQADVRMKLHAFKELNTSFKPWE